MRQPHHLLWATPTNSSQSDSQHKHFQELYTHQFCCRFSQNIANLFPSNNFVIKRCLYYKIHILSITVDLSILWGILRIYPNSNLTKKVKCYITSLKYRDCQVLGSCISTEKHKKFCVWWCPVYDPPPIKLRGGVISI